jgi:hypothetical protein
VAASWCKVLDLKQVSIKDKFLDMGGHSLMLVRLISEINLMHKVSLGIPELVRSSTVEQMARLIDDQRTQAKQLSKVIQMQQGRTEPSVYFMNPGLSEFRIAQQMGESHAVFGIEVRWPLAWRSALASNRKSDYPSLEQVVAPYVAALSACTRSSPCVLAGYSFAGLMVFEAAHQLQKLGGKVELVILIDTRARPRNTYQIAWHKWRQVWKQRPDGSTWGDFGEDDELGRINLLTPAKVLQGVREVKEGHALRARHCRGPLAKLSRAALNLAVLPDIAHSQ